MEGVNLRYILSTFVNITHSVSHYVLINKKEKED
jgi:hypothetical protein